MYTAKLKPSRTNRIALNTTSQKEAIQDCINHWYTNYKAVDDSELICSDGCGACALCRLHSYTCSTCPLYLTGSGCTEPDSAYNNASSLGSKENILAMLEVLIDLYVTLYKDPVRVGDYIYCRKK